MGGGGGGGQTAYTMVMLHGNKVLQVEKEAENKASCGRVGRDGDRGQERRWKQSTERTRNRRTQIGEQRKRHERDKGGRGECSAF